MSIPTNEKKVEEDTIKSAFVPRAPNPRSRMISPGKPRYFSPARMVGRPVIKANMLTNGNTDNTRTDSLFPSNTNTSTSFLNFVYPIIIPIHGPEKNYSGNGNQSDSSIIKTLTPTAENKLESMFDKPGDIEKLLYEKGQKIKTNTPMYSERYQRNVILSSNMTNNSPKNIYEKKPNNRQRFNPRKKQAVDHNVPVVEREYEECFQEITNERDDYVEIEPKAPSAPQSDKSNLKSHALKRKAHSTNNLHDLKRPGVKRVRENSLYINQINGPDNSIDNIKPKPPENENTKIGYIKGKRIVRSIFKYENNMSNLSGP